MKKVYVIFPALAMLIFFGFWWNFSDKFEAKKAAIVAAQKIEKQQKLEQDARDREKAIMDALASQAVRKAEREANEAKKQKDREDRQTAKEESLKAFRDKEKLGRQVERLTADVTSEKEAISKQESKKNFLVAEKNFLKAYVNKAEANQADLTRVIQKIIAADDARAKAEAAAAASAKKNS